MSKLLEKIDRYHEDKHSLGEILDRYNDPDHFIESLEFSKDCIDEKNDA